LELTGIALVVTILIAVPVGVLSARYPNSWIDQFARGLAVLGQSVPVFWLGILLILLFSVRFHVLPAFGSGGLTHALLPGLTLAAYSVPITMRMLRSNLIEVLNSDYIRTARSKGISGRAVLVSHGLRNAALPVLTVFALRVGTLLGGSVVAEQVFAYPGLGQLALQSISDRDYPVLQAFVLLVALLIVGVNLLMDALYAVLDPRIRVA
jgi:peptide/nickel transport system permease protein